MKENMFFQASRTPITDLKLVAYEGQDPMRRMYRTGYEHYLDTMPILNPNDPALETKVAHTQQVMKTLADELRINSWVWGDNIPGYKGFNRTILAMESPLIDINGGDMHVKKEGVELIIAKWGDGMSSPVHGHSTGYIHEDILFGKMRVNTYRMVNPDSNIVRPVKTEIVTKGTFLSLYAQPNPEHRLKRQSYIHNFVSIGYSASLHFVPEHTRDGRDNRFEVEYFEDYYDMKITDVTRINAQQGLYLQKGEVVLVRSTNVPDYGDHFIVITGRPVMKEHGLRPQETVIQASPLAYSLLDFHDMDTNGLILLKLNKQAKEEFLKFHDIQIKNGEVIFPQA